MRRSLGFPSHSNPHQASVLFMASPRARVFLLCECNLSAEGPKPFLRRQRTRMGQQVQAQQVSGFGGLFLLRGRANSLLPGRSTETGASVLHRSCQLLLLAVLYGGWWLIVIVVFRPFGMNTSAWARAFFVIYRLLRSSWSRTRRADSDSQKVQLEVPFFCHAFPAF